MLNDKNNSERASLENYSGIELLTIKEAANFLKVSVSMIRRLQYGRQLPFIKVGGAIRFNKQDIIAYLSEATIDAMH